MKYSFSVKGIVSWDFEDLKIFVMDRVQAPKIPAMHAYIIFPDFHLNFHYNDRQRQTMLSVSTLS